MQLTIDSTFIKKQEVPRLIVILIDGEIAYGALRQNDSMQIISTPEDYSTTSDFFASMDEYEQHLREQCGVTIVLWRELEPHEVFQQ